MYALIKHILKQKWTRSENEDDSADEFYSDTEDNNKMESDEEDETITTTCTVAQMPKDEEELEELRKACQNVSLSHHRKSYENETVTTTNEEMEQLREACPHVFLSNHRKVPGIITIIHDNNITVNVEFREFVIDLTSIKTECDHEVGDRVDVLCLVENEELFSGEIMESLEPLAILPILKKKHQKCMVMEILDDCVVLNNNCFLSKSVLKKCGEPNLHVGENIYIDMIESNVNNFQWRGIYCAPYQKSELANLMRGTKKSHKNSDQEKKTEETTPLQRLVLPAPTGAWRLYQAQLGEYANQVWSQEIGQTCYNSSKGTQRRFKPVRIPIYDVPLELRETYLQQCSNPQRCHRAILKCYPVLGEDLTFDNYKERFQTLLWLEEIEIYKNFRQYDIERAQFQHESVHLTLTIQNLGERRPSLVIGDKVRAFALDNVTTKDTASNKESCFVGLIQMIHLDKIYLKFPDVFHSIYDGEDYRLEFFFSRLNARRRHYALYRAHENLGKDFLFPDKVHLQDAPQLDLSMDSIKWYNKKLNILQRSAVLNILRGEAPNMPYIIYGPPGTGKTMTLVECILQLITHLPYARLLVATPSNSAANLICSRLIESQGLHKCEMVRLVSYNLIERDQIPKDILPYCATADCGEDGTYEEEMYVTEEGIQMNCPKRLLAQYRVTIGTTGTLGKYLELGFDHNQFTYVLVDEAGQCTEPDIMVPLSQRAKNQGRVVLTGDPMQLTAVVVSKSGCSYGLAVSYLERLMRTQPYRKDAFNMNENYGYNSNIITKLCTNYRSTPTILRIYNYLFYDLELEPTVSISDSPEAEILKKLNKNVLFKSEKRTLSHGAFFYDVRGENVREKDSPSWCNPREANIVYSTTLLLYRAELQPEDIGIITPYQKQAKLIRNLFNKSNMLSPKIGSVEEFQGQERNVILLSTVRTSRHELMKYDLKQGLGFVSSERRLNVAISRARALLIVFGDSTLLRTDICWSVYIRDCMNNSSYLGPEPTEEDAIENNVVLPNVDVETF